MCSCIPFLLLYLSFVLYYKRFQLQSCGNAIQHWLVNMQSGAEHRWLEQCSRNSVSNSTNSSQIPHPKHLDTETFVSTGDSSLFIFIHNPYVVSGRGPATPSESVYTCMSIEKRDFVSSATPPLINTMKSLDRLGITSLVISRSVGGVPTSSSYCFAEELFIV